jgi:hypothetical protein
MDAGSLLVAVLAAAGVATGPVSAGPTELGQESSSRAVVPRACSAGSWENAAQELATGLSDFTDAESSAWRRALSVAGFAERGSSSRAATSDESVSTGFGVLDERAADRRGTARADAVPLVERRAAADGSRELGLGELGDERVAASPQLIEAMAQELAAISAGTDDPAARRLEAALLAAGFTAPESTSRSGNRLFEVREEQDAGQRSSAAQIGGSSVERRGDLLGDLLDGRPGERSERVQVDSPLDALGRDREREGDLLSVEDSGCADIDEVQRDAAPRGDGLREVGSGAARGEASASAEANDSARGGEARRGRTAELSDVLDAAGVQSSSTALLDGGDGRGDGNGGGDFDGTSIAGVLDRTDASGSDSEAGLSR